MKAHTEKDQKITHVVNGLHLSKMACEMGYVEYC